MNKFKWYALRVISGKERKAKEFIDKLIEQSESLSKKVHNVILPMEKVYKIRNTKKYMTDKNFFPGYLLIEAELNGEVIHEIENAPNVMHFLKDGKRAIPLRESEVKRILTKLDDIKDKTELDIPFIAGESVQIVDGPFASFNGIITEINPDKRKAKVNVKIFGRDTSLELGFVQLGKV